MTNSDRPLIFLYGTQKSGTTWLRNMVGSFMPIAQHAEWYLPALAEGFENHFSSYLFESAEKKVGLLRRNVQAAWSQLLESSLPGTSADKSAYPCVAETGARADLFPYAGDMKAFYAPESRRVLIVRDPRDVLISSKYYFGRNHVAFNDEDYLSRFFAGWAQCNLHWLAAGPTLLIRYEDLKKDFRATARQLFETLGITMKPVDFEGVCGIHSSIDGLQQVDPAFYRKGAVGDWKTEMSGHQNEIVWRHCGEALTAFGYDRWGAERLAPAMTHPRGLFESISLERLLTRSWNRNAGSVQMRNGRLDVRVVGDCFSVVVDDGVLPPISDGKKLLLLLEVAWDRKTLFQTEGDCFGATIIRGGQPLHQRRLHRVFPRSQLYGKTSMVCLEVDGGLLADDSIEIRLFNGPVTAPVNASIHGFGCTVVDGPSGLAAQLGDLRMNEIVMGS